jgi:hypothetical protein
MSTMTLTVHSPASVGESDVRELLAAAEGATIAHEPSVLEALASAYRLKAEIILARRSGVVVGALPILKIRGPLGATDSSVAYLDGGGPIGPADVRDALVCLAADRALARGATLELRSRVPLTLEPERARVLVSGEKELLVRDLPTDPDAIAREITFKTRNHVRKALREGLWSESRAADHESLLAFRSVYARTMRDLGSPPHGFEVFRRLARALGTRARVSLVRGPGDVVLAAALVLDDRQGHAVLPWAASDRRVDNLEPNSLLYHEILFDAARRGRTRFSFGRSSADSPQQRFKMRWGAQRIPIYWTTVARPGPARVVGREARLAPIATGWKKLPLPLTNRLGPLLRRWIAA